MQHPLHQDILQYEAAQALCGWVGSIISRNLVPSFIAKLKPNVAKVLADIPHNLPKVLPSLKTVPSFLADHHRRLAAEEKRQKKVKKAHLVEEEVEEEEEPGSRIYSLSGSPTTSFIPANMPVFNPRSVKPPPAPKKKGKAALTTPAATSKKRGRVDSPPSPSKKGKSKPLFKVHPLLLFSCFANLRFAFILV